MWLLFLPVFVFSQDPIKVCPTYGCHLGGEDWGDTCFKPVNDDYMMQICESTSRSYCDLTPSTSSEVKCSEAPEPTKNPGYPGEACELGSECLSGTCTDKKCQGNSYGSSCTSHADCQVGAYCGVNDICEPQLGLHARCYSNWDCSNELACNRTMYEPGNCIPYYSIKSGEPLGICVISLSEGLSNLCESGSCKQSTESKNGEGLCQEALTIQGLFPKQCFSDEDCIGSNSYEKKYGSCECGMNRDGYAYCNAWSGDYPSVIARMYLKQHLASSEVNECHTMARFSDDCIEKTLTSAEIERYKTSQLRAQNNARYVYNDFCTQEIINKDYWNSSSTYHLQCKRYSCATDSEMIGDTCFTYSQGVNSYYIRNCTDPSYSFCDFPRAVADEWRNRTCTLPPIPAKKYPGEFCRYNDDCISNNCWLGYCKGIAEGMACFLNEDCDLGLYCKFYFDEDIYSTICSPLMMNDEVGCGIDFECEMNSGCNITTSQIPGTCIKYFSVPNGGIVNCPETGISYLCESGACYYQGGESGICVDPPKFSDIHPKSCMDDSDCIGYSGSYKFKGTCQCGYNNFGYSWCLPFLGDYGGQAFIAEAKTALVNPYLKLYCQTIRRFTIDCWASMKTNQADYDLVYVTVKNFTNYSSYLLNQDCVIDVITYEYWSKVKNSLSHYESNGSLGQEPDLQLGSSYSPIYGK